MVSRTDYASLKGWLELELGNLLAKQYHEYDQSTRVIKECKARVDSIVGSKCLTRTFAYDANGIPTGGTPFLSEWTQLFEDNQSSINSVSNINSMLQSTASALIAGFDYDSIGFTYPINTKEVITYKKNGTSVRVITIDYVDSTKSEILNVCIA